MALHDAMQKERVAFASGASTDAAARAELPRVLAELAATRALLEQRDREQVSARPSALRVPSECLPSTIGVPSDLASGRVPPELPSHLIAI